MEAVNPYANHPQLSQLEGEVLWEYAKLARVIRRVDALAKDTAVNPNESLLTELRALEKKMGLVLTLFKASVWSFITDSAAEEEAREMQAQQEREMEESERRRAEAGRYGDSGEL